MPEATAAATTTATTADATTTATTAAATPDWTTGLDAEASGYIQNKGWKGPADVLTSYRNLEKLHGVPPERIVKLPADDNAEAWGQVYDRLGRPKTPAEYGIKAPEKGGDPKFLEAATTKFHELGLNARQAAGLAEWWNKTAGDQLAERDGAYQESVLADTNKLKTEWGGKFDENVNAAKNAAKAFGLEPAAIDKMEQALGFAGLMKLMHNIGSKLGTNDTIVSGEGGNPSGFGMSREAAVARRAELMRDKAFGARFAAGDVTARAEMRRLDMAISA